MLSPIERAIDIATGFKRERSFIILRCPVCGRIENTSREMHDPKEATYLQCGCPQCKYEGELVYLDAEGKPVEKRSEITIELPYPPSVNHYWRNCGKRFFISAEGKAYKAAVAGRFIPLRMKPLDGRLAVDIQVYVPDQRQRDLDNLGKSACDSMTGYAYIDDNQIDDFRIRRVGQVKGGKAIVTITQIGPPKEIKKRKPKAPAELSRHGYVLHQLTRTNYE